MFCGRVDVTHHVSYRVQCGARGRSALVRSAQWRIRFTLQRKMISSFALQCDVVAPRPRSGFSFSSFCSFCQLETVEGRHLDVPSCIRRLCAPLAVETYLTVYKGEILNSVYTSFRMIDQFSSRKVSWNKIHGLYLVGVFLLLLFIELPSVFSYVMVFPDDFLNTYTHLVCVKYLF